MKPVIKYGSDPEVGAVYKDGNGEFNILPPYYFRNQLSVPAEIEKKNRRHPIFLRGDGYILHEDGAAFEMTIRASSSPRDLFDMIQQCAKEAGEKILSQFPDYCMPALQFLPSVKFDVDRWADMPEDFREATTFGCDPDQDAVGSERRSRVEDASKHPWRYLGGHIHFSGVPGLEDDPIFATQCLAITAGLAATAYSDVPELENQRTFRYGVPGRFRPQSYPDGTNGIEYRTISCRWADNWELAEKIFHWGTIGVSELFGTDLGHSLYSDLREPMIQAIVNTQQETAKDMLSYIESRL